jgi:hypothetical protein
MDLSADTSDIERARRAIGRAGFVIGVGGLLVGVLVLFLGYRTGAAHVFAVALAVLLAMPVKNVLAVLADEVRRRDWWFVLLAVGVLVELLYSVFDQLQ